MREIDYHSSWPRVMNGSRTARDEEGWLWVEPNSWTNEIVLEALFLRWGGKAVEREGELDVRGIGWKSPGRGQPPLSSVRKLFLSSATHRGLRWNRNHSLDLDIREYKVAVSTPGEMTKAAGHVLVSHQQAVSDEVASPVGNNYFFSS